MDKFVIRPSKANTEERDRSPQPQPSSSNHGDGSTNKEDDSQVRPTSNPIWNYFEKNIQNKEAQCNVCQRNLYYNFGSTSTLMRHLKNKHRDIATEFEKLHEEFKKSKSTYPVKSVAAQQTISACLENQKKWKNSDPRSQELTDEIGRWIATSLHPYTLVEETGLKKVLFKAQPKYKLPVSTTFSRTVIPNLTRDLKENVKAELAEKKGDLGSISLTTDMWTSRSNVSFISVTCHFMDEEMKMRYICLGNFEFETSHTAVNIAGKLDAILEEWSLIDLNIPVYVVTDNARNITAGVHLTDLYELQCFAHTIQLVIKHSKNQAITTVLKKATKIVGHYKHSAKDTTLLKNRQEAMGRTAKTLIQNVETRWNSEYAMLERLLELKEPLALELMNIDGLDNLTKEEWQDAKTYVHLLQPIAEATEAASGNYYPTRSMVIPSVLCIKSHLDDFIENNFSKSGIGFAKNLRAEFDKFFPTDFTSRRIDLMCMMVDPRFKTVLLNENDRQKATKIFKRAIKASNFDTEETEQSQSTPASSATKPKLLWTALRKCAKENDGGNELGGNEGDRQADIYLGEPVIPDDHEPLLWWNENLKRFPHLKWVVKHYLPIPATEVASERVFSTAGNIVTERRMQLSSEHVEQLVFLHENLNDD